MKNTATRIYDRWQGYTLDDCACEYCLHNDPETKICQLEVCCCLEEKQAALVRLRKRKAEAQQCPV